MDLHWQSNGAVKLTHKNHHTTALEFDLCSVSPPSPPHSCQCPGLLPNKLSARKYPSQAQFLRKIWLCHQLPEFTQTHVHRVSDAIQPSHPLLSPSPPPIPPSIRVFSNESTLRMRWPEYWSFSISPSKEHPGLTFRMDWLDLLAVQGTLRSLLQHHSSKASVLWCSAFFLVQLSHPYMTTGKIVALTRWTFVGKVMLLLFNMLSRFVITFLPRSKCPLISWLQSPSAVILEPKKIKAYHCFHCFPIYLPWSDGTGCHNFSFLNIEF